MDSSEQDLDSRTLAEKYFCLLGEREVTKNQNRTLQLSNQQLQEQVSKLVTNHQKVLIEKNEKIQHLEAVMETTVGRRCNLDDEEYLETVAKVDRLEQQVSGYQAKIKELEAKLAVKDAIKKELQDRRHAHEDLKEEYFSTKNQLERAADQLRQNHIAKTEREDKIEELEKKLASLRTEKNGKLETKLVELQEENRRLQNEIVIRANQMDQSECKSFEIQKKFDLQQSEFKKLQYRLTEVEDNCEKQVDQMRKTHEAEKIELLVMRERQIQKLETTLELKKEKMKEMEKELKKLSCKLPEPTQLHIELGKLYVELQEAKKPQDAQLTAKTQELAFHMEQNKKTLAEKESEIQKLKESLKNEEEKNLEMMDGIANLNMMVLAKDRKIEEWTKKFYVERSEAMRAREQVAEILKGSEGAEPKKNRPEPYIEYGDTDDEW